MSWSGPSLLYNLLLFKLIRCLYWSDDHYCLHIHKNTLSYKMLLDILDKENWEEKNRAYRICGQQRLRSACAFTQPEQGFRCSVTKSLDFYTLQNILMNRNAAIWLRGNAGWLEYSLSALITGFKFELRFHGPVSNMSVTSSRHSANGGKFSRQG